MYAARYYRNRRHSWLLFAVIALLGLAARQSASAELPPARERYAPREAPSFQRHVLPLVGRLGCNGRACHGSFQGQGGFRLSMFGFDFAADHLALTGGEQPRVDVANPSASLILNKPTSDEDHGGGLRFERGGWEYQLLRDWIDAGAKDDSATAGKLLRLEIVPADLRFEQAGQERRVKAVAHWSDGTREDVTCLTRFSTNDDGVTEVSADGVVRAAAPGHTFIIARYDNGVTAVESILPMSDFVGDRFPNVPTPTEIDRRIVDQLSKLGIVPSELCADEEFLRRASLDITGTLPLPDEVRTFTLDPARDKRARKIDELLARPTYVTFWTNKLCDQTGLNGAGELGRTEFAPIAGDQWRRWIEHRVETNAGYDTIARGVVTATSRRAGQSYDEYVAEQTSYVRAESPVDFATRETMPYFWFRTRLDDPDQKALNVAYAFLGVRLDCAQCHKHPFDQWSQKDFQQFAALFDRVAVGHADDAVEADRRLKEVVGTAGFKNAAERRKTYRKMAAAGKVVPWQEIYVMPAARREAGAVAPRVLGGEEMSLDDERDPRLALVEWMLDEGNPYFARAFVNRVWAHYFGVGIVEPTDDANLGNPPVNAALLDYLSRAFIDSGYDMRWLHREVTNSHAYQRSWRPTETNRLDRRHFSHAIIHRLPAEVVVDAIAQATAADADLAIVAGATQDRAIGQLAPPNVRGLSRGLAVFGRPLNLTTCDCERQTTTSLLQAIYLRNDEDVWSNLDRPNGWVAQVARESAEAGERDQSAALARQDSLVEQAYSRALSRRPTERELARCRLCFADDVGDAVALRDILWALLNTQEFVTQH